MCIAITYIDYMYSNTQLFQISLKDRPRERLNTIGAGHLTDAELVSIVLRSGERGRSVLNMSQDLISKYGGLMSLLQTNINKLQDESGIGFAKASTIKAVFEICMRVNFETSNYPKNIRTPRDVWKVIRKDLFSKSKEHLFVISLDSRFNLISKDLVSVGTVNETLVHPREVFKSPIENSAVSVVLVHNHPSNDPTPSEMDLKLTSRIEDAGKILGIALLDHVIVTDSTYISLQNIKKSYRSKLNKRR